jgi:general secretion pathway protein D
MERSKSIASVLVGLAAILIIWRVGFYPPVPQPQVAADANLPLNVQKQSDANAVRVASEANELERPARPARPDRVFAAEEPNESAEPNEPMEFVNLKNVEMKDIIEKLAKWTGKTIIPSDESMKQRITIYAPEKLPRKEALSMVYSALRLKGFVAEQTDDTIFLKPIGEAKLGEVPTISDDYPLAAIENKDQVVQKFFKLKNYSPSQMGQIILPLVGDYGYVSADESTGSVLVIDTVKSLMRISLIIEQYDVVEAEEVETRFFEIHYGDPTEIVNLLQMLLTDGGGSVSPSDSGRGRGSRFNPRSERGSSSGTSGAAVSVTVGTSRTPAILVPQPNYNCIIAKATADDLEKIERWIKELDRAVPTILADRALASIENKNQRVQTFFKLENYSPSKMAEIVEPLLGENGHVSAEESTGSLMAIDTVENLMRIEMVIKQFDVPEAEQTVTQYFEIKNSDPSEIVQLLRLLISGETGTSSSRSSSRSSYSSGRNYMSGSRGSSRTGSSSSVIIGPSEQPVVLIPVPRLKWIIARASAEDMRRIDEWILKLDTGDPVKSEHETISLRFIDATEVAEQLNEALQSMPGSELQSNILVQPLAQAKQIMIFGRADMREMVKKLIQEIDIPSGLETKVFKLKHADADQIKENIDNLYGEDIPGSGSSYYSSSALYYYYRYGRTQTATDIVKVISFPTMQQVTVIASPENLVKIEEQLKEWDVPLDVDQVKPQIIELHNSDPTEMASLLTTLFTEESDSGISYWDFYYGSSEDKKKIVGPLYGQLTFEAVPGTKKIIVISKIPAAYDVIKQLILDLDRKEMAEVPDIIELKYADPEDLSERLNAMFIEEGQNAPIRYTAQGLSEESEMDDSSSSDSSNNDDQSSSQSNQNTYTPPWSGSGARSNYGEEASISNVIGRIRFVPEPHTKSILTLAPPEFMDEIEALIHKLDVPGKQVMIEAVIVQVDHSKVTSLGIELSTNPNAFGTLGENALLALGNLTHLGTHGTAAGTVSPTTGISPTAGLGATGSGTVLGVGTDVYTLIDFLIETTDAKILNQQTLWMKDNEAASFFKGEQVPFLGSVTQAVNVGTQQDITYQPVGMQLKARPSITPENKVDIVVNVEISRLTTNREQGIPIRSKMNTTTNMIVDNKQTLLLGGMLFQIDSLVERKLPLLGDLPLIGGLFRHNEVTLTNSEMFVFMTPHVVDESAVELPDVTEDKKIELEDIRRQLEEKSRALEREMQ